MAIKVAYGRHLHNDVDGNRSNDLVERDRRLRHIYSRMARLYGARLRGIVLYGSEARGEAKPDSDIDILVLLRGPVEFGKELDRIIDALYVLDEEWNCRPIHAHPTDVDEYESGGCALFRIVKDEGIVCQG